MKVLANDGFSSSGIEILEKGGFEVLTTKVAQEQLESFINEHNIDALLVKNKTQVLDELIETCPSIKLIGKAGIEMDNIDTIFAKDNGIHIIHTPNATSNSIAELVFAHLFGMVRFLHQANREMPLEGETRFNALKKEYSSGIELKEKTLGIIGKEPASIEVAKIALGIGMKVVFVGDYTDEITITIPFFNGQSIDIIVESEPLTDVLKTSDFLTLHAPIQEEYIITSKEFEIMKDGIGIINVSYGGLLDEVALVNAIEKNKVKYAGLDVFENQPTPEIQLLMNPDISLTPHIGSQTVEAQNKGDLELAKQIIELLSV
jgi:D-3-phosphoglycerate dehydrogenase